MVNFIFDIQHRGKPSNPTDMGAGVDIDGDKKVSVWEMEAERTTTLASFLTQVSSGKTIVLATGNYSDRHLLASRIAKKDPINMYIYLAAHMNAGKTSAPYYGLIGHDSRSGNGSKFADFLKKCWAGKNIVTDVRTLPVSSKDTDYKKNVFNTIAGIWSGPSNLAGVCLELAFLEDLQANSINGLFKMAEAINEAGNLFEDSRS
jgi:hypothetical protein